MRYKYIGDSNAITLRGVTFENGKAVDLSENTSLAEKVSVLDYFAEVKTRAKKHEDAI